MEQIEKLFTDPKYHDVEFIFPKEEGAILKANKCFLAENSVVWEKMFCGENWKDSGKTEAIIQIIIEDAESEMFKLFLKYCYLKEITLTQNNALYILLISETYIYKELIKKAAAYIRSQNTDYNFMLRILGEMSEPGDVEIESVQSLKVFIKKEILDNPYSFLVYTNFSNLSPAIKDTICDLFSQKLYLLHESHRLNRIIEYGKALKKSPDNADKEIEEILTPFKKYINIMELGDAGILALIRNSLITYEEACNYTLDIMKKNFINSTTLGKSKKLKFSLASFQGSMMDRVRINPNTDLKNWEETWCLDIRENNELKITFLQPQMISYIACELKEPYEGTEIDISYSENGTSWLVDSIHYPTFDTCRRDEKLHQFYIKEIKKWKYWRLCGKSPLVLGRNLQIFIAE